MILKYQMSVHWNGACVLSGAVTASMAYGILRQMAANFPNPLKANWVQPSLNDLVEAERGRYFECHADDGTGRCSYGLRAMA